MYAPAVSGHPSGTGKRWKHQNKDLDAILRSAEKQGCRVVDAPKGRPFKVLCSCPDKHRATVHRTPSGSRYPDNKLAELRRWSCWRREAE